MAFAAFYYLAVLVFLKAARSQGHGVIQFYPRPDPAGFAHDHAGAVIDEKMRADFRAGMNIDAGAGMGPFRHEPRDQRHFFFVKKMRHSLDRDRFNRRIRDDDFLVTRCRRIAFVSGVDIGPKDLAQAAQLRHEPVQNLVRLRIGVVALQFVEALGNLRLHPRMEPADAASGYIRQIA